MWMCSVALKHAFLYSLHYKPSTNLGYGIIMHQTFISVSTHYVIRWLKMAPPMNSGFLHLNIGLCTLGGWNVHAC